MMGVCMFVYIERFSISCEGEREESVKGEREKREGRFVAAANVLSNVPPFQSPLRIPWNYAD